MKEFFGKDVMLGTSAAVRLYEGVRTLPIIDCHCHLNRRMIVSDAPFSDIGQMWLEGDHYKWRAMRMCGVDEQYITGSASFKQKFIKYAEIMPLLIGNPLYYFTHFELSEIFGIDEPLCADSAERIYEQASKTLKSLTVQKLLKKFNVEFIATTDDPVDNIDDCGVYGGALVTPTFRPDKLYCFGDEYISKLGEAAGVDVSTLDGLLAALNNRLDYFAAHGCKFSDHGFEAFPKHYATIAEARELYLKRNKLTAVERDSLFGFVLVWLAKAYHARGITMQIHFSVIRNCNTKMLGTCGVDSGFDLIGEAQPVKDIVGFLDAVGDSERPDTVLYTLNDSNLAAIAAATGAFRKVRMGAAWWFNDSVCGIKRNLATIAEYSVLGNNLGMLTDSRSFCSYSRFDFFRRILCDFVGTKVERGEYDEQVAADIVYKICYSNAKRIVS